MSMKDKLLEVLSPQELEEKIDEKMENGARSEQSALNKIMREHGEIVIDELDAVSGRFLTTYVRNRDGQRNVVIANADGVKRVGTEADTSSIQKWQPVEITDVVIKKNIRSEGKWKEGTDDTVVKILESYHLSKDDVIEEPSVIHGGGLYLVAGNVSFVNRVAEDVVDGVATGYYPVLDGETVNLRLQVEGSDGSICRVKIHDRETLKRLLDLDSVEWIEDEWEELIDMLVNLDIVVFGGGNDQVGDRQVTRFMQLRSFGFVEEL